MANQLLWGFTKYQDVAGRRVTETGLNVENLISEYLDRYNAELAALMGLFVRQTTDFKLRYVTPLAGRLQPLDENGRARPVKGFSTYDNAWPLHMAGTAFGLTYLSQQKITVQELNDIVSARAAEDTAWVRDHILAALFYNAAGWTFTDTLHGALTIHGLANGDTVQYQSDTGGPGLSTADHYLAQAAAIADVSNPFPTIYSTLINRPDNGGDVIVFVPTANRAAVEALTTFTEVSDPNIQVGSTTRVLTGAPNVAFPGTLFGYVEGCFVVEWSRLPSNYLLAVTTEGEPPLAMRQDETASLQGFKLVAERNDHPWYERQFLRIAGFGSWNRVGALVQRVGNGSYAIPTNYTSPMP